MLIYHLFYNLTWGTQLKKKSLCQREVIHFSYDFIYILWGEICAKCDVNGEDICAFHWYHNSKVSFLLFRSICTQKLIFNIYPMLPLTVHSVHPEYRIAAAKIEICVINNFKWFQNPSITLKFTGNEFVDYCVALDKYSERVHIFL